MRVLGLTFAALSICLAFARAQTPRQGDEPRGVESVRLYPVLVDFKTGYIDHTGSFVIPPQFSTALEFSEGLAGVSTCAGSLSPPQSEGDTPCGYGYIDRTGRLVVEEKFDYVSPFRDGLAHVYEHGRRGYIDRAGNYVWKPSR